MTVPTGQSSRPQFPDSSTLARETAKTLADTPALRPPSARPTSSDRASKPAVSAPSSTTGTSSGDVAGRRARAASQVRQRLPAMANSQGSKSRDWSQRARDATPGRATPGSRPRHRADARASGSRARTRDRGSARQIPPRPSAGQPGSGLSTGRFRATNGPDLSPVPSGRYCLPQGHDRCAPRCAVRRNASRSVLHAARLPALLGKPQAIPILRGQGFRRGRTRLAHCGDCSGRKAGSPTSDERCRGTIGLLAVPSGSAAARVLPVFLSAAARSLGNGSVRRRCEIRPHERGLAALSSHGAKCLERGSQIQARSWHAGCNPQRTSSPGREPAGGSRLRRGELAAGRGRLPRDA